MCQFSSTLSLNTFLFKCLCGSNSYIFQPVISSNLWVSLAAS
uniref:Uncharacterized protein n=1 Tax=Arundo donax TaxID=35708 RepID=A0A0A8ZHY0_ARUDO